MRFHYDILPDRRLIVLRFRGPVGLQEILAGVRRLWADPIYQPEFDGVADLDEITTTASLPDVRSLLQFLQHTKTSRGRWAVIFNDPKAVTLGLLFKAASTLPLHLEVVSNWTAACAHLRQDIPADLQRN